MLRKLAESYWIVKIVKVLEEKRAPSAKFKIDNQNISDRLGLFSQFKYQGKVSRQGKKGA